MIHSIHIRDSDRLPVSWWPMVPGLARRNQFTLSPGLNILWGRNGSGKSTLLTLLARYFHAEQGGHSVVTMNSCRVLCEMTLLSDKKRWLTGLTVRHDGKPVFYANPAHAIGLVGGSFDDDFMIQGAMNAMHHGSAGETTVFRTRGALAAFNKGVREVEYRTGNCNDLWEGIFAKIRKLLKSNAAEGPFTLLLDEPDRSLDLDWAANLWLEDLPKVAEKFQVIVATHSFFARAVPGARYIELTPGYLESIRELFTEFSPEGQPGKIVP